METEARKLRDLVERTKQELERAQKELSHYETDCQHEFVETYDPIHHEGHTLPGDPPGTMGVDWRGPVYVPPETIDRWRRECRRCGLVEYTKYFKEEQTVKKIPDW